MIKGTIASFIGFAVALCSAQGLAHDPQDGQGGVDDHGHDDGHHHHPHAHEAPPAPSPEPAASPYGYRYSHNYTYNQTYNHNAKPRVIDDYRPGDPIPEGYRPDTQARSGLVKAGAATLFSVYGVSVVAASFLVLAEDVDAEDGVDGNGVDPEAYYPLFIPVAGPFVTIATADTDRAGSAILVANGIAQTAGLAMFIAGLAAQEDVLVRIPTYGQASVEVKPLLSKDIQGVGVDGSF